MGKLVLTRQQGETVVIAHRTGERICTVVVTEIKGDRVRLGFDAGDAIAVDRLEVAVKKEGAKAS